MGNKKYLINTDTLNILARRAPREGGGQQIPNAEAINDRSKLKFLQGA